MIHKVRPVRQRRRSRKGATLIEFAIVAQVMFLIIFTCVEFCRLNMIRNLTQDAAYYAARDAMVHGATVAEAKSVANRILGAMGTRGVTVLINDDDTLDKDSDEINVTVTVPIDENALFLPKFTDQMNFTATATMRTERYDGFYVNAE